MERRAPSSRYFFFFFFLDEDERLRVELDVDEDDERDLVLSLLQELRVEEELLRG